ncbi:MAG: zinc-ribbon and DUF3426 domain-containing protein [Methylococcales bacterium]|nr:zinc-ribbon and DUF3426 domain-containing protein [Methylococcales bacterium]
MFTQCPDCKKKYSVTAKKLRTSQGMLYCKKCNSRFDALFLLKDGISSTLWNLGFCCSLITFAFQVYFFEGYNLTQNPTLRPWLEKSCQQLKCQLPHYKNLTEFTILHGSFEPDGNNNYVFKTAFTNQSAFEQSPPSIKLTLTDFKGHTFAERIFHPKNYLKPDFSLIQPEMSIEMSLDIATPSAKVGGYVFELI